MSTAPLPPRPEPVLEKSKVTQAVTLAGPLLVAVLIAVFGLTQDDAEYGLEITATAVSTVVGVVNFIVARVQAHKARALVTPIADPLL